MSKKPSKTMVLMLVLDALLIFITAVFVTTSVIACFIDLVFVIIQRYNRPRLIKLMEKKGKGIALC